MTSSRLVRGSKTRMFAFVCLVCVLGAVLFVFHGTQTRLADVQKQAKSCNQQKETFRAQFQVLAESKNRSEKALNKEITELKRAKELFEQKWKEGMDKWSVEKAELNKKYDALAQKNNLLQADLENAKDMTDVLQKKTRELEADLDKAAKDGEASLKRKDQESESLKTEYLQLKEDLQTLRAKFDDLKKKDVPELNEKNHLVKLKDQLYTELESVKQELATCKAKEEFKNRLHVLEEKQPESHVVDIPKLGNPLRNGSSTPGINPDAVGEISSVKPSSNVAELKKDAEQSVFLPPKTATQESQVLPLGLPKRAEDNPAQGQAQIPGPPDPHGDTLQKPNVEESPDVNLTNEGPNEDGESLMRQQQAKGHVPLPDFRLDIDSAAGQGGLNGRAVQDPPDRGEEENEQVAAPQLKQRNPDSYHGGDYDKEQAEEEDEEVEQMDYEAGDRPLKADGRLKSRGNFHVLKQIRSQNGGVMIQPK